MHETDIEALEGSLNFLSLMAGDDDHRSRLRSQRLLGGDTNERFATNLGDQLVDRAHAGRAASREHDSGHPLALFLDGLCARLRASDNLPQQTTNAHAGDVFAPDRKAGEN